MKSQKGFTLLELMIVIAIIAISAAATTTAIWNWYPEHNLRKGANDVIGAIRASRLRAVKERTPVCIDFSLGTGTSGTYTSFEDSGEGGPLTNRNNGIQDGDEPTIVEGEMPEAIEISDVNFTNDQMRYGTKGLPMGGLAGFGGSLEMTNAKGNFRYVIVDASGNARVSTAAP